MDIEVDCDFIGVSEGGVAGAKEAAAAGWRGLPPAKPAGLNPALGRGMTVYELVQWLDLWWGATKRRWVHGRDNHKARSVSEVVERR